jgi:hypothetical protein
MSMRGWRRCTFGVLACVAACAGGTRSPNTAQEPREGAAPSAAPSTHESSAAKGADKSSRAPAAEAATEMASPRAAPAPDSPAAGAAPPAPAPEYARPPPAPGAADPHGFGGARARLSEARRELDIAASERDCARACRALESMERAAQQVCDLARSADERSECASAGDQVDKARAKVQSACGGCPRKSR